MGALTIAFDTIIVGALALPWVLLAIHLFFFEGENRLQDVLDWVKKRDMQAVAGILLFAMAFTLGSAVSRIAQDFFNDDDLRIPWIFRMTMTEDRIIASVYCESDENLTLLSAASNPVLAEKLKTLRSQKSTCCSTQGNHQPGEGSALKETKTSSRAHRTITCTAGNSAENPTANPTAKDAKVAATGSTAEIVASTPPPCPCQWVVNGIGSHASDHGPDEGDLIGTARDIFGLEENGLYLKGEDATLRLRQLHDQIMVLRGSTFDGLISFSLCLFAWGVKERREKTRPLLRWALALVPAIFLLMAGEALYHHIQAREIADPPYMEFSLVVIGLAGVLLLWRSRPLSFGSDNSQSGKSGEDGKDCFSRWRWGTLSLLFGVLFIAGVLGWWATEVLYGQQVIYSYDSQSKVETTKASQ